MDGLGGVTSVAYSPDGSKIVSSGKGGTIKVWDAINFRPHVESEWEEFEKTLEAEDSDEEDEIETWWRNKITGHEQSVKPSGYCTESVLEALGQPFPIPRTYSFSPSLEDPQIEPRKQQLSLR